MRNKWPRSILALVLLAMAMSAVAGCESSSLHQGMPTDMRDLPIPPNDTNVSVKQSMGEGR